MCPLPGRYTRLVPLRDTTSATHQEADTMKDVTGLAVALTATARTRAQQLARDPKAANAN